MRDPWTNFSPHTPFPYTLPSCTGQMVKKIIVHFKNVASFVKFPSTITTFEDHIIVVARKKTRFSEIYFVKCIGYSYLKTRIEVHRKINKKYCHTIV